MGARCTARQEQFALKAVDTGNLSAAYRAVFDVKKWTARSVWVCASTMAALPQVRARIEQLRADAAAQALVTRERVIHDIVAQLTCNVNELVSLRRYNCRHCNGDNFGYQWRDDEEYSLAVIAAIDHNSAAADARTRAKDGKGPKAITLPSDAGGYGYTRAGEPNLACPECLGDGIAESIIHDTTKLEGGALLLYAGLKETSTGPEVKLHDKSKLLERLCAMMGWNKDAAASGLPATPASATLPADVTEADAAKAYLRLVGGTG